MSELGTIFMFSGQGSHYYQMGGELFENQPLFRDWMVRMDDHVRGLIGESVVRELYERGCSKSTVFDRTLFTHPAIFMVEYALAQVLIARAVAPVMTLGVSLGSFAAAAVAGALGWRDALTLVVRQAQALETTCERGGMVAIMHSASIHGESLHGHCDIAAENFPGHFVIAAPESQLGSVTELMRARGITHQRLAVSFAFHSRWIEPARALFRVSTDQVRISEPRIPIVCCAHGQVLHSLPHEFFWESVRTPARLEVTVQRLERSGGYCYVDVGPAGTLAGFMKSLLPAGGASRAQAVLSPFGRDLRRLASLQVDTAPRVTQYAP